MFKKTVGVLYLQFGDKKTLSNKSKDFVVSNLDKEKFKSVEIELSEENTFIIDGEVFTLDEVSEKVDIIFNCLIDKKYYSGKLQKTLELLGIDFVGPSSISSSISSSKFLLKEVLEKFNFKTISFEGVGNIDSIDIKKKSLEIFSTFPQPCVFKKDLDSGLYEDIFCSSKEDIEKALNFLKQQNVNNIFLETYVEGTPITIYGIENFIDQTGEFYFTPFNSDTGESVFQEDSLVCMAIARDLFEKLSLSGHFSINLIHSKKGVYISSVDNFPALYKDSVCVRLLKDYGIKNKDFLTHLISDILK